MAGVRGTILVADDNAFNRIVLTTNLEEQGYTVASAENGIEALEFLRAHPFDVVLLDIVMPGMDGYQVLEEIKKDSALQHIPVIVISAIDDLDSIVRCIEMGATDYLPRPFDPAVLRARLNASLAAKRLRDLELEYLERVGQVADAAAAVELGTFDPNHLSEVSTREDALGRLARVFTKMAREMVLREQRMKRQLERLRVDMEEMKKAATEPLSVYLPMDRRQALAFGVELPARARGAALLADISGFTPLTDALVREMGVQGAEELSRQLNAVYGALVAEVDRYGGSVVTFNGDGITCWFEEKDAPPAENLSPSSLRAAACALAMQDTMSQFYRVTTPNGTPTLLRIRVVLAAGMISRFGVGSPAVQQLEVIAGRTLDELDAASHIAERGEIVATERLVQEGGGGLSLAGWRTDGQSGARFAILSGLTTQVSPSPWPPMPGGDLHEEWCRPWLLPTVYERVRGGKQLFLSELRPAAALFLKFSGIDYDEDPDAGHKLDRYVRWVQTVVQRYDAALMQLMTGDKGSSFYIAFGAPIAHQDDAVRAVCAARDLSRTPAAFSFITGVQIGIAYGQMWTGAFGSSTRRAYGAVGSKVNLAARLMIAATEGTLCDEGIFEAARPDVTFEPLAPIMVKGKPDPVPVYRPTRAPRLTPSARAQLLDQLSPSERLVLKVASIAGITFPVPLLRSIMPVEEDLSHLEADLYRLVQLDLLIADTPGAFAFTDPEMQRLVYDTLLFAQRRQLHRAVAEWYEQEYEANPVSHYALLAEQWRAAENSARAIDYYEKAGQAALARGALQEAERLFKAGLDLEAQANRANTEEPIPEQPVRDPERDAEQPTPK
ncbi:MAG: response regulator [Anaerolineae bacterium]